MPTKARTKLPGKVIFKSVRNTANRYSDCGLWISQPFYNGEFTFFYALEIIAMEEAVPDPEFKYGVEVAVISPECFSEKDRENAKKSNGETSPWDSLLVEEQVEMIKGYCGGPTVFSKGGDNVKNLVKEAHKELRMQGILFGFNMDRAVNGIGTTGWDLLTGNIMAGLDRYREENPSLANSDQAGLAQL